MQLDDDVLQCFGVGRVFKEPDGRINSIDFHRTEDLLVTAGLCARARPLPAFLHPASLP